ncbi:MULTISPECIES: iron uptake porin [unclassified Leptolyngbya]|uniref:iron uptake porin n=1 Tax=unclassified Leptolyngbya TaxID=2650499 RepID=UPI0016850D56|nr:MULTISPECIES: iron uptake porin [unclassified Leptolyngbya]MBD1910557.1 iron uptake porin [Leptolyngbya sp. FACHB-8]MBD2153928.1 iron uptake porin [Leptolyngbya sp. FACHB-16]
MSKLLWKSLLVAPAVLGATLVSSAALAQTAPAAGSANEMATLDQVMQYSNEGRGAGELAQVTSVTQFSDVSPSDWAYEALSFLANSEDQGGLDCLEGYPDGTYRGNRALTRYEFAAGLAACLDAIAGAQLDAEQLARIEALQREFAAELAALRGRVDALEAAVDELEANQFSTTTRLRGEAIFAVSDIFGGENLDIGSENNVALGDRVRLNFDTSFTGDDLLRTRLQSGDFNTFQNVPGTEDSNFIPEGIASNQTAFSFQTDTDDDIRLDDFYYQFPLGGAVFTIGLNSVGISDIVTSVSPFDSSTTGSVLNFGYNPIYDLGRQDEALGVTYDFGDAFQIGAGYLTDEASDPSQDDGLFNGDSTFFGQLTFDTGDLTVAATYVNAYVGNSEISGAVGDAIFNGYGLSANFVLGDVFNIGGWISYIDGDTFNNGNVGQGEYWSYAATLGVEDLGIDGSLLGLIVGVPTYANYDLAGGGAIRQDNAVSIEALYRIPLSDNISITPSVAFIDNVGNDSDNDAVVIGTVRTSFRF